MRSRFRITEFDPDLGIDLDERIRKQQEEEEELKRQRREKKKEKKASLHICLLELSFLFLL